jgi:hypothetical protein
MSDLLTELRGVMRSEGDRRYLVRRRFTCTGHVYALSAGEAEAIAARWSPEDYDSIRHSDDVKATPDT